MSALYATPSLATHVALLMASKKTGRAAYVPFTGNTVLRAEDGSGPAYTVRSAHGGKSDDYEVVELTADEVNERVRRGMLREADKLDEEAEANEAEVAELRLTGKQRQRCERLRKDAERDRARAESLRAAVARGTFVDLLASCGAQGESAKGAA